ncbi:MAG: hypothetical protein EBS89_09565 [Proteobacteria bacterium]|nr:hypothetical protein [Pseudomonadota bacterium]
MLYEQRICPCGSGKMSDWQFDGNGLPLTRTCPVCHRKKMSGYRPEILSPYGQGDVDEPIDPEPEDG